jgi:hypothetical protein
MQNKRAAPSTKKKIKKYRKSIIDRINPEILPLQHLRNPMMLIFQR